MTRRLFPLAVASATSLAHCNRSPASSCYGLEVGDRVAVTVVEPYDKNSRFPVDVNIGGSEPGCGFGFDVVQNQVLVAEVKDHKEGRIGCATAVPALGPVGPWTWSVEGGETSNVPHIMSGDYMASGPNGCSGLVVVVFDVTSSPFTPSVPGQVPHVVMTRSFQPYPDAASSICSSCDGQFVVDLQRLDGG